MAQDTTKSLFFQQEKDNEQEEEEEVETFEPKTFVQRWYSLYVIRTSDVVRVYACFSAYINFQNMHEKNKLKVNTPCLSFLSFLVKGPRCVSCSRPFEIRVISILSTQSETDARE